MASMRELDTFVKKLKNMWNSRIGAHPDNDTYAGKAPGPPHYQVHQQSRERSRNGHSQHRCQERRGHEQPNLKL